MSLTPQPNPLPAEVTQLLLTVGSGIALGFLFVGKRFLAWIKNAITAPGSKRKNLQQSSQLLLSISALVDLKDTRKAILSSYKDEGRKIVRRWAAMLVHVMQGEATAVIRRELASLGVVDHDPVEVLLWKSAGLSGRYMVTDEAMISVESNHYNEKTDRDWELLQSEIFNSIWPHLMTYYSDLYRSNRVGIDKIIGAMETDRESHFKNFCGTFDRLRVLSVEVAEKVATIDKEIDAIIMEYRLKETGK